MIRVYLDWSVLTELKNESASGFLQFLELNARDVLVPASAAHLADASKSNRPNNDWLVQDMDMLRRISRCHFMFWGDGAMNQVAMAAETNFADMLSDPSFSAAQAFDIDACLESLFANGSPWGSIAKRVLEAIPTPIGQLEQSALSRLIFPNAETNTNLLQALRAMAPFAAHLTERQKGYKGFREQNVGFRLRSLPSDHSEEDAMRAIDELFNAHNIDGGFVGYIDKQWQATNSGTGDAMHYFLFAYLTLDMIGYEPDDFAKKSSNMMNLWHDASHAYYGAHNDIFITKDNRLRRKASMLYRLMGIATKVVRDTEAIDVIANHAGACPVGLSALAQDAFGLVDVGTVVESCTAGEEGEWSMGIRLPHLYLGYFSHAAVIGSENGTYVVLLRRVFKGVCGSTFALEDERAMGILLSVFSAQVDAEINNAAQEVLDGSDEAQVILSNDIAEIRIQRDELNRLSVLVIPRV